MTINIMEFEDLVIKSCFKVLVFSSSIIVLRFHILKKFVFLFFCLLSRFILKSMKNLPTTFINMKSKLILRK